MKDIKFEILDPPEGEVTQLSQETGLSPIVARVLLNRGVESKEQANRFLKGTIDDLYPPENIDDLLNAVDIILEHIDQGNKILIHGDYDADGVTSTVIMIKALERLGCQVGYYIPDRFDEGYGFASDAIRKAIDEGYSLIVTVDCGSSNWKEVAQAREAGIQVIVTDHHEVPDRLPDADAFINVKKSGDTYPFKDLSGAGVAIKLISALYTSLGRDDWTDFLDMSAIGTVADVVPLVDENRLIVKEGLKLLNERKRPGIASLLNQVNSHRDTLTPWDISFIIAPRINAAGRLADATVALHFLLEEDEEKAAELATRLIKMNEERQRVETAIKEDIERMINENPDLLSQPVWVFGSKGWHQGVIGIVASRFSDNYKRPVFLVSIGEDGLGRGSARCGENYNVYEALETGKDLLEHYGGHRLAGGFSLQEKNIDALRERVSSPALFSHVKKPLKVDGELFDDDISLELARELESLAPFGEGNPKPLFLSRRIKFQSVTSVGNSGQHLKVWVSLGQNYQKDLKGISFGKGSLSREIREGEFYYDLLYNLDIDFYNNQEELALKIIDIIQPQNDCLRIQSGLEGVAIKSTEETSGWKIVDARPVIDRRKYIKQLAGLNCRSLILTRSNRQMKVLMENLKHEGVSCINLSPDKPLTGSCKGIFIAPFENELGSMDVEEVLLYHPPYDLKHFSNELYISPGLRRVHILFGDEDVAREENIQELQAPDRRTLLKIYGHLKEIARDGKISGITMEEISRPLNDKNIRPRTVYFALKIFSELDLLDFDKDKNNFTIHLKPSGKTDLESSSFYANRLRAKERFQELKHLYLEPSLINLEQTINNLIQDTFLKEASL